MQVLVRMSKTIGFRASGLQLTPRAVQVSCCEPQGLRCFVLGIGCRCALRLSEEGESGTIRFWIYPRETPASRPFPQMCTPWC